MCEHNKISPIGSNPPFMDWRCSFISHPLGLWYQVIVYSEALNACMFFMPVLILKFLLSWHQPAYISCATIYSAAAWIVKYHCKKGQCDMTKISRQRYISVLVTHTFFSPTVYLQMGVCNCSHYLLPSSWLIAIWSVVGKNLFQLSSLNI